MPLKETQEKSQNKSLGKRSDLTNQNRNKIVNLIMKNLETISIHKVKIF